MVHGLVNIKTYSRNGTRLKKLEEHLKRKHDDYKNKNIDKSKFLLYNVTRKNWKEVKSWT